MGIRNLAGLLAIACVAAAISLPARAGEMTFQFINDTERALSLKLFVRGEAARELPARTKAWSLRPDKAVQQLKVECADGENICWGAWMKVTSVSGLVGESGRQTRTGTMNVGAGERGLLPCPSCCHVCKAGTNTPLIRVRSGSESTTLR